MLISNHHKRLRSRLLVGDHKVPCTLKNTPGIGKIVYIAEILREFFFVSIYESDHGRQVCECTGFDFLPFFSPFFLTVSLSFDSRITQLIVVTLLVLHNHTID